MLAPSLFGLGVLLALAVGGASALLAIKIQLPNLDLTRPYLLEVVFELFVLLNSNFLHLLLELVDSLKVLLLHCLKVLVHFKVLLRNIILKLLTVSLMILRQEIQLSDQQIVVFSYFEKLVLILLYLLLTGFYLLQVGQIYYFL